MSSRWRRSVILAATAVVTVPFIAVPANAEPQRTIEQVEAQLEALENRAEGASEALNGAQADYDAIAAKADAAAAKVAAAQADLDAETKETGRLAAQAYRSAGVDAFLGALTADTPTQFLDRAAMVQQLSKSQDTTLRRAQVASLRLAQAQAAFSQQEDAKKAVRDKMAQHKAEIDSAVAETQTLLASLQEEERQRLAAIEEQKRAEAARAAAQAAAEAAAEAEREAAAERAQQAAAAQQRRQAGGGGSDDKDEPDTPSNSGGSSRGMTAVRYALSQVGDPYSYSANPPSSWDCSKLTAAAWRAAGVSLTAYSYAQAQQVRRVSTSDLQPGDLLFYFNGAHHVALYIGGGKIVEAASPRFGVQVTSLWNSWTSAHFSFAGRPG
ncbi:MAG: NlpC/P60 family protein [Actinomycetota bacterium]|nr:MAG: NlpC/P60 family protein [Actinomycetota bacterium]